MATSGTMLSSTRWGSEDPTIYISATYETKNRTSTTVDVRVKLSVSAVNGESYFGFNIQSRVKFPGLTTGWVMVKESTPSQWSSPLSYDFGWKTISQPAASKSFTATICMDSNTEYRSAEYQGTVAIDIGNTAPVWPSGAVAQFNSTNSAIIVGENVTSLPYGWSAASDAQGDTILYRAEWFKNGVSQWDWKKDVTGRSFLVNPGILAEGGYMFFRVYCRDSLTSYGSYKQSNRLTRNKMTPASISSIGAIGFNTTSFNIVRTNASNLNGNSSFTYTLSSSDVTVYNGSALGSSTTIRVSIWRSGSYPSGPYVRFSDIQAFVGRAGYTGEIRFTLSTKNAYNTTKTSTAKAVVDLRVAPAPARIMTMAGTYTINGKAYYVINRRPVSLTWAAAVDKNTGTADGITYSVQTSTNKGAWTTVATGLTGLSYNYPTRNITASQEVAFRIIAKTAYNTSAQSTASGSITLHSYNPPVISNLVIDRAVDKYALSFQFAKDSTIPAVLYDAVFRIYDGESNLLATLNGGSASQGKDSYALATTIAVDSETTAYAIKIIGEDTVARTVFSLASSELGGFVPRYSALLSIREKGIGINAIAGDFADFITKGTSAHYGGESGAGEKGSLNAAVDKDSAHNFYVGCYRDSEGLLRSSYASPAGTTGRFRQVQIYFGDSGAVPMRYRWLYPKDQKAVGKDAVIADPTYAAWQSLSVLTTTDVMEDLPDYIVETGNNDNGQYVKYHSGRMICWCRKAMGTITWENRTTELKVCTNYYWTFPAKFVTYPTVSLDVYSNGYVWTAVGNSTEENVQVRMVTFVSTEPYGYTLSAIAIGNWK